MPSSSAGGEFVLLEHMLLYAPMDAATSKGQSEVVYRREILLCDGP